MTIHRRGFLTKISGLIAGLSVLTLDNTFARSKGKSRGGAKQKKEYDMQLRPHHILDIITGHDKNIKYEPAPYGHSQHIVAPKLISNLDMKIKLVVDADDICEGCIHLLPNGKCDDVLAQFNPSPSKQAYNDVLDCLLLDYLSIEQNSVITTRKFLEIVNKKVPGIEKICTHPKESQEERLMGLISGLNKLGIREQN